MTAFYTANVVTREGVSDCRRTPVVLREGSAAYTNSISLIPLKFISPNSGPDIPRFDGSIHVENIFHVELRSFF